MNSMEAERLADMAAGIIYGTPQWDAAHYGRITRHWMMRPVPWWHDLDLDGPVAIERARWNGVQAARAAFRHRPDLREETS